MKIITTASHEKVPQFSSCHVFAILEFFSMGSHGINYFHFFVHSEYIWNFTCIKDRTYVLDKCFVLYLCVTEKKDERPLATTTVLQDVLDVFSPFYHTVVFRKLYLLKFIVKHKSCHPRQPLAPTATDTH